MLSGDLLHHSINLDARRPREATRRCLSRLPATLVPMAFWTDGAAYAPIERPNGFAVPDVEPLTAAEPAPQLTPGAVAPPSGFAPMSPAVALKNLGKLNAVTPPGRCLLRQRSFLCPYRSLNKSGFKGFKTAEVLVELAQHAIDSGAY